MAGDSGAARGLSVAALFLAVAGTAGRGWSAPEWTAGPTLVVSVARVLAHAGRNPTLASHSNSGAVYVAWAQDTGDATKSGAADKPGARIEVRVARSDDGGRTFGPAVVASLPDDHVESYTVSPTQVAVGPKGEVYVLYGRPDPSFKAPGWESGRSLLRLVRSDDRGKTFSAPVEIGGSLVEGITTSLGMLNLFAAHNGDLYASFLDFRESLTYRLTKGTEPPKDLEPATQLRVARSTDGGRTFGRSLLVSTPVCGCCGTKVAQGIAGPLYAATRGQRNELKGSYDAVRDPFVSISRDGGTSWSLPVKFHDDRFKVSGCPDVAAGIAVDSLGRLHVAWYTGTDRRPGVFYARSDDEGNTFSKPIALLSDDWIPYGDVKLALDSKDYAWVAFEDRRGEEDLIQVARIAPDGSHELTEAWPGNAPDVATTNESAVVAWCTTGQGDEAPLREVKVRMVSVTRP